MKGSLKNNLKNVYKNVNNNNVGINKNITGITNRLKNDNMYSNFLDNGKNLNNNIVDSTVKKVSNYNYHIYIILIVAVLILLILLIFIFKDNIINYFRNLLKDKDVDDKLKNLEDVAKSNSDVINKEIKDLDEKLSNMKEQQEIFKKEEEEKKRKKEDQQDGYEEDDLLKNKNKDISINAEYDKSNIINEDSYCYVGSDDNIRHCVKAYAGDICTSGEIYKRLDKCLIPELIINGNRSKSPIKDEKKVDINNKTGTSNIMFDNMDILESVNNYENIYLLNNGILYNTQKNNNENMKGFLVSSE
tara:strand:- start:1893 stop:2801 length:909 start_codon:yes stop_codon:yes gene_type:complete